jgi:hypothetical protein
VTTRQDKVHTQLGRAAVQIFAANERMNQVLIENLDPPAWRAKPSNPTLQRTKPPACATSFTARSKATTARSKATDRSVRPTLEFVVGAAE